ncbi:MAG: ribosome maturation factor RimP [Actinobacteria bacterium]|nr:ribosome maturation factor RimP [Actinomycetota bacterium]MCL5887565.1 ribosome maturation factor RimP [Actinomycetota bacterium]
MSKRLQSTIEALLTPAANREGFELVAVEVVGVHRSPVIRIFLDHPAGIDVERLASANKWISDILDAEDPVSGSYTLEVSSPGVDRPLSKKSDFVRFLGETASIKTDPIDGRSSFTGAISDVTDEDIVLSSEVGVFRVPFTQIKKARLKGKIDFSQKGEHPK